MGTLLGCFHLLAVVTGPAMIKGMNLFETCFWIFWMYVESAQSHGSETCKGLRNCLTDSTAIAPFTANSHACADPAWSSHSTCSFYSSHSSEMITDWGVHPHSVLPSNAEPVTHASWQLYMILEQCLFMSFAHFKSELFCFVDELQVFQCIFKIWTTCQVRSSFGLWLFNLLMSENLIFVSAPFVCLYFWHHVQEIITKSRSWGFALFPSSNTVIGGLDLIYLTLFLNHL